MKDRSRPLFFRFRDRTETRALGRFDRFAKPSANDRYLRTADGRSRRVADVADRGPGRLIRGGKRVFPGNACRGGVRPKRKSSLSQRFVYHEAQRT